MAQREFDITIGSDGQVEVHVRGIKGKGCMEVIKMFEEVVGQLQSTRQTNEFYEPEEEVRFHIDQRR